LSKRPIEENIMTVTKIVYMNGLEFNAKMIRIHETISSWDVETDLAAQLPNQI
jgi:hypothetical protein